LTSAANRAFEHLWAKFTHGQNPGDPLFVFSTLSLAYATPKFTIPTNAMLHPVNSVAVEVQNGLLMKATATLNIQTQDPVVRSLANLFNGNDKVGSSLLIAVPSKGPVTITFSMPEYTFGNGNKVHDAQLTVRIPTGTTSDTPVVPKNACSDVDDTSLSLQMALKLDTMINGQMIYWDGSAAIAIGKKSQLSVCVGYQGTITNAFGFSFLSLSNLAGSLTFIPTTPFMAGVAFQGTVSIGAWSATGAFSVSLNPSMNYFYVSLDSGLTVNDIHRALVGNSTMPDWIGQSGFGPGTVMSYSGSDQTLQDGTTQLKLGFCAAGSFQLFGQKVKFDMQFVFKKTTIMDFEALGLKPAYDLQFVVYIELMNDLNIGTLIKTVSGEDTPAWLNTGFGAGTYLGYSTMPDATINGRSIPVRGPLALLSDGWCCGAGCV
jgi:hypothetical protein